MAKNKVYGVSISLMHFSSVGPKDYFGRIYFNRKNKDGVSRCTSSVSIYSHNLARALEAQRLFLAQLEKASK